MELKKVVPFQFMTQVVMEQKRKNMQYNTDQTEPAQPEALSLSDLLREGWQGRRFFKIYSPSEDKKKFDGNKSEDS